MIMRVLVNMLRVQFLVLVRRVLAENSAIRCA